MGKKERRRPSAIAPKWWVSIPLPLFKCTLCQAVRLRLLTGIDYSHIDEPDEVEIVKKALAEHLDLDPQVTLSVLCDQIVPSDDAMDDEERSTRERLSRLVISFLSGQSARRSIDRHAKPGSEAEQVLVNGLLSVSHSMHLPSSREKVLTEQIRPSRHQTMKPKFEILSKLSCSHCKDSTSFLSDLVNFCNYYLSERGHH